MTLQTSGAADTLGPLAGEDLAAVARGHLAKPAGRSILDIRIALIVNSNRTTGW